MLFLPQNFPCDIILDKSGSQLTHFVTTVDIGDSEPELERPVPWFKTEGESVVDRLGKKGHGGNRSDFTGGSILGSDFILK